MTEFEFICQLLPKVIVATICGLIVGWEREVKNKVAGIRTHVLICVGVSLFTAVGFIIGGNTDPSRIIGQIVTGIGFLGGGVIFKDKDRIVGVTSAAFIWFIASVGVIVGMGYLLTSVLLTIGFLVVLLTLEILEKKIIK